MTEAYEGANLDALDGKVVRHGSLPTIGLEVERRAY